MTPTVHMIILSHLDATGTRNNYDIMWTDMFPVFFWRDTFAKARASIAQRLAGGNFDNAYMQFNKRQYSQFNILANWALQHQPEKYTLKVLPDGHGRYPSEDFVTLGSTLLVS